MSEAKVDLTVQDGGAVSAWQRYKTALEGVLEVDRLRATEDKKAGQAAAELGRIKARVLSEIETKEEKLKQRLGEINRLRDAGRLTEEQYSRAVMRTREKLLEATTTQKEGAASGVKGFEAMATKLGTVALGYVSVQTMTNTFIEANKRIIEQANDIELRYDNIFRQIRVQGGMSEAEGAVQEEAVLKLAETTATPVDRAGAASRQMISSGADKEAARGEGLEYVLKSFKAGNLESEDPTQLTQAFGQWLAATGQKKNSEGYKKVAIATQRLFEGSDLQVSDLGALSGQVMGFMGRVKPEEMLGMFDIIRDKTNKQVASTGLKIFGDRLTGAKGDKTREDALKKMKLKPEDVDFLGESPEQVLDQLARGIERIKPEAQKGVAEDLFGTEAGSHILGLIRDRAKLPGLIALQSDEEGFEKAYKTGSAGPGAAKIRGEIRNEIEKRKHADRGGLFKTELETSTLAAKPGPLGAAESYVAGTIFDTARAVLPEDHNPNQMTALAATSLADWRTILGPVGMGMRYMGVGGESLEQSAQRTFQVPDQISRDLVGAGRPAAPAQGGVEAKLDIVIQKLDQGNTKVDEQTKVIQTQPAGSSRPNTRPPARRPAEGLQRVP